MKRLRVGVIYGGRSGEHEVSLASAAAVFAHLDRQRYEPVPIRIEKDGRWALAERAPSAMSAAEVIEHARLEAGRAPRVAREVHLMARPSDEPLLSIDRTDRKGAVDRGDGGGAVVQSMGLDVVFPVLHGPYGEDGTVQGLLELANLPYVGCGVLASAVGMDKGMMKVVFAQHGLPQVDYAVVLRSEWARNRAGVRDALLARLPAPLFVKPANLGSSVGISKVHDAGELDAALDLAAGFDRKIVVEAGVPNAREIECAVLGNDTPEASMAGEVVPSREFYDYEAKYLDEGSKTIIPADLTRGAARRGAAAVQGGVPGHRRDRPGAGRLPPLPRRRTPLRERGEHAARLHHHQHVLQALGSQRRELPRPDRSPDRAGHGAPRRQAAVAHERPLAAAMRVGRALSVVAVCIGLAAAPAAGQTRRRPPPRSHRQRPSPRPCSPAPTA